MRCWCGEASVVLDQMVIRDGNQWFTVLGGTVTYSAGRGRIRFCCPGLRDRIVQNFNRQETMVCIRRGERMQRGET
jgi:hypothetical protein